MGALAKVTGVQRLQRTFVRSPIRSSLASISCRVRIRVRARANPAHIGTELLLQWSQPSGVDGASARCE